MKRIALCCALALCLALTACAPALPPQPTLEELLAEVNAAHQAVQRPEVDAEQYLREGPDQETVARFTEGELTAFNSDAELTAAQAAEDVEYLFEAFRTLYGPYEYFGGDETFGAHKAELLARLAEKDSWTAAEVQDLLLEGLRFFQDGHFNINGGKPNPPRVPFFFREAAFYKTEEGGYIREDGRRVASVDGCDDLDGLFKRSISQEGDLVYYPVLLEDVAFDMQSEFQQHACSEKLTVRYADGSSQTLTAEPWSVYVSDLPDGERTELRQAGGVPVFQFNNFVSTWRRALMDGANALADAPVGILDLRSNTGGMEDMADSWLLRYSGQTVPSNGLRSFVINGQTAGLAGYTVPDGWVENDRVLIVLTGKRTASCAELLLERTANLENVLVIGENTSGAMMSNACRMQLPRSGCQVTMTVDSVYQPSADSRYEELRGYEPDIWVPAAEAEELAVKWMKNLGAVGAPQE